MRISLAVLLVFASVSFGQSTSGQTTGQPRGYWDSRPISSEAPDGYTPPVPTYDDTDFYTDPSKPHLRFFKGKKKEETKPVAEEKKYPRWEKNGRGEEVLWISPDDYYIREKEPSQVEKENAFYAQLGRDFFEAAASQSNLGEKKLMSDLQIHKEGMQRRVYLNRLFRVIADYERSTLPN